ncbi:MAG: hypothetical protein ACRCSI_02400, partial [Eubacterium aggregans]
MALNLLFSRNRSDDSQVRFLDVPVQSNSIMIDMLSILSQFRRTAGWLYPIRPASTSDYERGKGQLILFGKSRVIFPDFTPPYYLEFFPRFGVGVYILSVYEGQFDVTGQSGWVNVMGGNWNVNYFPDEQLLRSRFGGDGQPVYDFRIDIVEAFVSGGGVFFKLSNDTYEKWLPYSSGSGVISVQEYELIKSQQDTIFLT